MTNAQRVSGRYDARPRFNRVPRLKKNPQRKGVVVLVITRSPKKPNSANRPVAKIRIKEGFYVTARLPGKGYLCAKYNRVLVHGGRANDLPGIGYTVIRGVYDFSSVIFKRKRRSIYGVERPDEGEKFIRRSFRK